MTRPVSPLNREHWKKSQELLARLLRGEQIPAEELLDGQPNYRCEACRDVGFVVTEDLEGVARSRRCPACRERVDSEIRRNHRHSVVEVDEDPPPPVRDFKQAAGLDEP